MRPRGSAAHAARPEIDLVELEHAGFALGAHLRGVEVLQRLEDRVAVHAQALHEGGAALLQAIDAHCLRELDCQPLDAPVDGRPRQPPPLGHGRVSTAVDHLAQQLDVLLALNPKLGRLFHRCSPKRRTQQQVSAPADSHTTQATLAQPLGLRRGL
jgi:hypothetical protein